MSEQPAVVITGDAAHIDVDAALALLRTTYWARDMTRETLERAMEHSMCFGVLDRSELVGFARVVTDRATFAYLTDVVISEDCRGRGLGHLLVDHIIRHPDLQGLRRFSLLARDTRLYEELGFVANAGSLVYMERR